MNWKINFFILSIVVVNFIIGIAIFAPILVVRIYNSQNKDIYMQSVDNWRETNKGLKGGGIVFLGDSITERFRVNEFFQDKFVINRGISGDTTDGVLARMDESVYALNPSKVFLMIGTNDLGIGNKEPKYIIHNIQKIIEEIKNRCPTTKIYLESIYPINNTNYNLIDKFMSGNRSNKTIIETNKGLAKLTGDNVTYIDVYSRLTDEYGKLKIDYTYKGLHLIGQGYRKVVEVLKPYVLE